jgi:long-chain acyl-CoA synthetase
LPSRISWRIADALVLKRIRASFGVNIRYFVSGSAPMPLWLLRWFDAIGLPVLEAYGVSEDIVPISVNRYAARKLGSVGRPLPGQELRLADDGEILVRGPGVARRASHDDRDRASPSERDAGSRFLATGDLGRFDEEGFLHITGRKSDVFKTSTGKWVAPAELEGRLARLPYVEHAVVLGAGRSGIIGVLCLAAGGSDPSSPAKPASTQRNGRTSVTPLRRQMELDVTSVLADLPSHQQLAGLLLLPPGTFSVKGGELTTNLKLRRKCVAEKYAPAIDQLGAAIDSGSPRPVVLAFADLEAAAATT